VSYHALFVYCLFLQVSSALNSLRQYRERLMPTELITTTASDGDNSISCFECQACCCQLEVILISETGVPARHIETATWGGQVMARLDDGLCSALDRETFLCTIYELRPWVCREFEMGSYECITERSENSYSA
jgi:hypothetical protein